ncbi:MAG: DUF2970 domain-containing protein [Gammaproteobacteria bacterium]|nr:MAG: DUF2970 domain-containing protein [Gammaproteobacteria bacterium]
MSTPEPGRKKRRTGLIRSVLGAAFGVQSSQVQEEDFQSRSPWRYVVAGIVFTVCFVLVLMWIVSRVVASGGVQ